jgi:hypothetical protein
MTFRPRTRFGRVILSSVALGLAGLVGCCGSEKPQTETQTTEIQKPQEVSLTQLMENKDLYVGKKVIVRGIPLSNVSITPGSISEVSTALTLGDMEGNVLLCRNRTYYRNYRGSVDANALVEAEMNDGDEESIALTGKLTEGGVFVYDSLKAIGYSVNLDPLGK